MLNAIELFNVMAQTSGAGGGSGGMVDILVLLVWLVLCVLIVAGFWKMFVKAGQPGWAAIVPIYNLYILLKIVGRPWWWLLLLFIPIVSLVISIIVAIDVAKSFGKNILFAVGLILLGFVFYPILGFGSAQYVGPAAAK